MMTSDDIIRADVACRGVIGKVQSDYFQIYTTTPYSAIFLLYAPTPTPIKIGFGVVRCGLVRSCSLG
jgi:hypothetical protein